MSNLPINAPRHKRPTNETASSKEEYLTEKLSCGMPSLMDDPLGDDKSKIILYVPSFLGTAPRGEQCNFIDGILGNGPDVCKGPHLIPSLKFRLPYLINVHQSINPFLLKSRGMKYCPSGKTPTY